MRAHHPLTVVFFAIATSLISFSVPGPEACAGSAAETLQTGILSGLTGQATAQGPGSTIQPRPLKFRDTIESGEQIVTKAAASAEILWGKTTLLTLFEQSTVQITTEQPGQTIVRLTAGTIRVAVAGSEIGSEDSVILETPTARVVTRGGILQASTTPVTRTGSASDLLQESLVHHVSYSYLSQTVAAVASATETVQVLDGEADVITGGSTPERRSIGKGQELLLGGSHLRDQTEARQSPERPILLAAVSPHALTPEEGTLKLVNDQQTVAAQLGRTLTGEKEESEISTGASAKDTILSTTFGAGSNLPGFPGAAAGISPPGTGVVDPPGNSDVNVVVANQLKFPAVKAQGGAGLLLLNSSTLFGSIQESFLVDGGRVETDFKKFPVISDYLLNPSGSDSPSNRDIGAYRRAVQAFGTAAHNGQGPDQRLMLSGFSGSNRELSLFNLSSFDPLTQKTVGKDATDTKLFVGSADDFSALKTIAQYGNNAGYDPRELPESNIRDFTINRLFVAVGQFNYTIQSFTADASIRARNSVDLKGGLILDNSAIHPSPTSFTERFQNQLNGVNSSVAALIGRDETGKETGSHPAFVRMQDRMLAVLNESSIAPADPTTTKVSLLTVLDSELRGPTQPPDLFPGDPQPAGVPTGKARADVPPLIELIDSKSSFAEPNFAVVSQSAITMRAELDQALLEASAPLISFINSSMKTTGDFVHVSGAQAQLTANVPNDQLILRGAVQLNGSTLSVGGHLFNITEGAKASMTGNLVALANGSTLNVAGALINVGTGSSFSLAGGSLVSFGVGTNNVNVTGATCAGCVPRTNIPNLTAAIPVVAHPSATITVQSGFVPFAGVGAGTILPRQSFNNTVNLPQGGMGALVVGQNATLALRR